MTLQICQVLQNTGTSQLNQSNSRTSENWFSDALLIYPLILILGVHLSLFTDLAYES